MSIFKTVCAFIGGAVGMFLGGLDGFLYALIAFVSVDYMTGVAVAVFNKTLSSEIGFKGICRKVLIFVLVGIANILDVYVLNIGSALRTAVIFYYIANEGLSILENTAALGLPIPERLRETLLQLQEKGGAEKEDGDS